MKFTFVVHAHPRASRNEVLLRDGQIHVYTTSPPTENEANQHILKLLAKRLDLAPSDLTVVRGHTARQKTIETDRLSEQEILGRIGA